MSWNNPEDERKKFNKRLDRGTITGIVLTLTMFVGIYYIAENYPVPKSIYPSRPLVCLYDDKGKSVASLDYIRKRVVDSEGKDHIGFFDGKTGLEIQDIFNVSSVITLVGDACPTEVNILTKTPVSVD